MSRIDGLALSLIDDAAMFPPGNATLAEGVKTWYDRRDAPEAPAVGPLLVPASAVEDLRSYAHPDQVIDVGLIGDTGLEGLAAARDALQDDTWISLQQVELRPPRAASPAAGVRALLDDLSFTVPVYVELALDADVIEALAVLADDGVERAKFRTGPFTVPTSAALAHGIAGAVRLGVRFKLTGGLHRALPRHDDQSGQEHHGFLNALAATALAIDGAPEDALAQVLSDTDTDQVLTALHRASAAQIRDLFCSFGSCSVDEPFTDLVHLGLADLS